MPHPGGWQLTLGGHFKSGRKGGCFVPLRNIPASCERLLLQVICTGGRRDPRVAMPSIPDGTEALRESDGCGLGKDSDQTGPLGWSPVWETGSGLQEIPENHRLHQAQDSSAWVARKLERRKS